MHCASSIGYFSPGVNTMMFYVVATKFTRYRKIKVFIVTNKNVGMACTNTCLCRGSLCNMLGSNGISQEASMWPSFPFTLPTFMVGTRHDLPYMQVLKLLSYLNRDISLYCSRFTFTFERFSLLPHMIFPLRMYYCVAVLNFVELVVVDFCRAVRLLASSL